MKADLEQTARALVSRGKGILAADETVPTVTKRFDALGISSTPSSRRDYRTLLITAPGAAEFLSGVIFYDETIRQQDADGTPLVKVCVRSGILPGIKVDLGAKSLAGSPEEKVTEGLDGLRERLKEYREMGARFAKWRAVITVSDVFPSDACVAANAHALARYAALCQEQDIVPIVELGTCQQLFIASVLDVRGVELQLADGLAQEGRLARLGLHHREGEARRGELQGDRRRPATRPDVHKAGRLGRQIPSGHEGLEKKPIDGLINVR